MAYSVHDRLDYLGERFKPINDDPEGQITYTRGVNTVDLTASLQQLDQMEVIPGVIETHVNYQHFIIDSDELILAAAQTRPQVGDTITRANGEVYQVVAIGPDQITYKYTTSTRKRMRIFCDQIS